MGDRGRSQDDGAGEQLEVVVEGRVSVAVHVGVMAQVMGQLEVVVESRVSEVVEMEVMEWFETVDKGVLRMEIMGRSEMVVKSRVLVKKYIGGIFLKSLASQPSKAEQAVMLVQLLPCTLENLSMRRNWHFMCEKRAFHQLGITNWRKQW